MPNNDKCEFKRINSRPNVMMIMPADPHSTCFKADNLYITLE
jgi:hypothetical protein